MFLNGKVVEDVRTYSSEEDFLGDIRSGNLPEKFHLSEEAWEGLATRINADKNLAEEIVGSEILIVLAAGNNHEANDLIYLAKACL